MPYDPRIHHRKSVRLPGHDYTEPGSYYVTICVAHHRCIFGPIQNTEIHLSGIGKIVDTDWRAIPNHFPNITLDAFQVMPNHLHGIVTINKRRETTPSCPPGGMQQISHERKFGKPIAGSLSIIIGAFKSGVTIKSRNAGLIANASFWQSRFYDHVIRDDVDYFMIQQYIELNPLMWEYDIDNPDAKETSLDEFEKMLKEKYEITGQALYIVMNSKKFNRIRLTS